MRIETASGCTTSETLQQHWHLANRTNLHSFIQHVRQDIASIDKRQVTTNKAERKNTGCKSSMEEALVLAVGVPLWLSGMRSGLRSLNKTISSWSLPTERKWIVADKMMSSATRENKCMGKAIISFVNKHKIMLRHTQTHRCVTRKLMLHETT